jgi:hypothetical protein
MERPFGFCKKTRKVVNGLIMGRLCPQESASSIVGTGVMYVVIFLLFCGK